MTIKVLTTMIKFSKTGKCPDRQMSRPAKDQAAKVQTGKCRPAQVRPADASPANMVQYEVLVRTTLVLRQKSRERPEQGV